MDLRILAVFCAVLLYCSVSVDSKSVAKSDEKKTASKVHKETGVALKESGSGSDDDAPIDCDPEKLKKCNIICEKTKTVEKRTCNCKEEQSKVECAEKRRAKCEVPGKKKCSKCKCTRGHGVEKKCKSAQGKKKSCRCAHSKKSPLMQRVFKFPALMITPMKSFTSGDKGVEHKKGSKRCGCGCCCDCCHHCCDCCHHCCCCEPCCCCCCEPCCCCHECCCPCCCHCCHCCHCCPCCCGCGCGGGGKKKGAVAPAPAKTAAKSL